MRYNRFNMIINIKENYSIDKANLEFFLKFSFKQSFKFSSLVRKLQLT